MSLQNPKGVALLPPEGIPHVIDHLAVVCVIMGIPFFLLDEIDERLTKKFYPEVDARMMDYQDFNPEFLIANYDVVFVSDRLDRDNFRKIYLQLEQKHGKRMRYVFCPHGFSDKVAYFKECANEDIILIYGQNMLDLFAYCGVTQKLHSSVIVGNYRYTYFKKHQEFYKKIVQQEVFSKFDKARRTILYAPTWLDGELSTSFFDATCILLDHLPPDYNMIVKVHPRLELDDAPLYYRILGRYEKHRNILFLKDFPPVYPLLAHTDIYIGDMSSVGYDFLTFNRPMFFLTKPQPSQKERNRFLYKCGVEIPLEEYTKSYKIIENNLQHDAVQFSKTREEIYRYTFGEERPFSKIKKEIMQACSTEEKFVGI